MAFVCSERCEAFVCSERCVLFLFRAMFYACSLQRFQPQASDSGILRMIRYVAGCYTSYSVMLYGNVTFKASSSAIYWLSFGVHILGCHCMPRATGLVELIPVETESEH